MLREDLFLGLNFFNVYTLPLKNIFVNLKFHKYAHELYLYFSCSPIRQMYCKSLSICDIRKWLSDSYQLKDDMIEFLMLGSISISSSLEKRIYHA